MNIDKFEIFQIDGDPLDERGFAEALVDLVNSADQYDSDEAFNEVALDLAERLLWTRQEVKYRERRDRVEEAKP